MKTISPLILAALFLTACESTTPATTVSQDAILSDFSPAFTYVMGYPDDPEAKRIHFWGFLEGEEAERARALSSHLSLESIRALGKLGDALRQASTKEEEFAAIEYALEEHRHEPYAFLFEQRLALFLLNEDFADGQLYREHPAVFSRQAFSGDQIKRIGLATDLLVRNNNPNAHLIASTLDVLEGYWSTERMQEAAASTINQAEAWLVQQQEPCENCGTPPAPSIDPEKVVKEAIRDLKRL